MFFLFSLILTALLLAFVRNPLHLQWVPYGALGVVLFGSWALIHTRRFVRAVPLVGTTTALFFTLLLLESIFLRSLLAIGIGAVAWAWWRVVAFQTIDNATERFLLVLFTLLFALSSTSASFAFAVYIATPLWLLALILFTATAAFCSSVFLLRRARSWFLAASAIALFQVELFLVVHLLPLAFAVKSLVVSLVLLTVIHFYDRGSRTPLNPRYVRFVVVIVLVFISALLSTAAWI